MVAVNVYVDGRLCAATSAMVLKTNPSVLSSTAKDPAFSSQAVVHCKSTCEPACSAVKDVNFRGRAVLQLAQPGVTVAAPITTGAGALAPGFWQMVKPAAVMIGLLPVKLPL